ncbi:NADP-dependent fatty aldehyde dehydrogenase [Planctomycetes bacterium Poly30]|uniref:NADP-dependent fatty aldehyde dehydrogenase n=1 Tax=Saltatorellus ferox TaxID=2528018 RepID=A0A518EMU6_9BACT|nr:NADP-dependent fatty aldehyde dehydrogenase [Planctomycetes bacterium Poly30]
MSQSHVLIAGTWRPADASGTFSAHDPRTGEALPGEYPTSRWSDCDAALDAAQAAAVELRTVEPAKIAAFLEGYAARIEARADEISELASKETALPVAPRLAAVELPRTTGQLRQAAEAARNEHWTRPIIDTAANIRTRFGPIGPVAVFGPNNFPLAFGSISGGDFAAAIAAGNPVIAKGHPLHPGTTQILAQEAQKAVEEAGLPAATVQLLYNLDFADGERLVKDPRLAAIAFTGSRRGGLALKAHADAAGKPIYLELGSVNPVVILPKALEERGAALAEEFTGSCLMGTGQFCTNPGLVIVQESPAAQAFVADVTKRFAAAQPGVLFSKSGLEGLGESVDGLKSAGAKVLAGGKPAADASGFSYENTVLEATGAQFLEAPEKLQSEAFGNATLIVRTSSTDETKSVIRSLEGNLTGCVYSATDGSDDASYDAIAPELRARVGRLINDKMPTGVAVSPAMNHGGPFPATSHPGFTAVGLPGSISRFAMLQCYDNVRPHRLPASLRDENPGGVWRNVDGNWSHGAL